MPEGHVEFEFFTIIFVGSLLAYENKYYLQVYIDNFTYKIVDTQMIDYLDDSLFESDKN